MKITGLSLLGNNVTIECDVSEFDNLMKILYDTAAGIDTIKTTSDQIVMQKDHSNIAPEPPICPSSSDENAEKNKIKRTEKLDKSVSKGAKKSDTPSSAKPEKAKTEKASVTKQIEDPVKRKEASINAIRAAVNQKKENSSNKKKEYSNLDIVRLHDEDGMSFAEIGKLVGVSHGTAYNRYRDVMKI